jgi:hypothetical protein
VDFLHQVQPIFREACYSCHGPEKSKAGLRLDLKARALRGGENGPVILPTDGANSPLVKRLINTNEDERMPQKAEPLPPDKIQMIREWIDQGAVWPEAVAGADPAKHWAFQRLTDPQPPRVKNQRWVRNPIDNFVLAKLEALRVSPNPEASRRALIRRANLDLLGLPPTPEEVDAFIADRAGDAYEKLLDRLLANPHYGERWARHWLDAARFAESDGFEQDTDRPYAYWYRDFVIKALNEDMPFDQFVRWQLAGDELAPQDPWAMAATGFIGAEQFPTQLTEAEFEQARYDELDNMAATTGTAMLGLTVGCARCHDHKYDPISNREYYRLVSTFTTTVRSVIDLEFDHDKYLGAKAKFDQAQAPLVDARDRFEKEELPGRLDRWLKTRSKGEGTEPEWILLEPTEITSKGGATFSPQPDGSVLATGKNPDFDTYTLVARTGLQSITGIRIEALADPSLVKGGPGRAVNGNFDLTDLQVSAPPADTGGPPIQVKLTHPRSTFDQGTNLAVALVIDDDKKSGWSIDPQFGTNHAAAFDFAQPVGFEGGTVLTVMLDFQGNKQHGIGRLRVSVATAETPLPLAGQPRSESLVAALRQVDEQGYGARLSPEQRNALAHWYRTRDRDWQKLNAAVEKHLKEEPKPNLQKVMVTSEGYKPIPHFADDRGFPHFYPATYFLKRGDARQKGEIASQGFLQILDRASEREKHWQESPPAGARTAYRRRALARWITDTQVGAGELLARVIVNRQWQHHFGRGIVATPNDFGLQGERPTHPELLDWLARDLITHGWQLKRLHKLMMLSAAYRESADVDGARGQADRDDRFLWHWPRRRLEAEAIRDSMLAVSGRLDPTMFGPGTLDPDMRRRSIYFFIKRSQLVPMLMLFDFPEPTVSVGARVSTTIAPQALAAMNSPQVRACARSLGGRVEPNARQDLAGGVREAYRIALGRQPDQTEVANAMAFIRKQSERYRAEAKPDLDTLALADFCQVLFGLNEFIYLD